MTSGIDFPNLKEGTMTVFDRLESEVQSYARSFPVTFETAEGAWLTDENGNRYLERWS